MHAERKPFFIFARGQEKLVSCMPGEKKDSHEPMKVSLALSATLSWLSRSRRMFLLRFFTGSRRRCGNVYLHLCHSLAAAPIPRSRARATVSRLTVFCSSSECVELARGKAYIYMNKVE